MARKSKWSIEELAQICECHCERSHHEGGAGRCWLCYDDSGDHCREFRLHRDVKDGKYV